MLPTTSKLAITCLFFQNKLFNKDTWVFDWRQFQQSRPPASDQQLYYQEFVNQSLDSCICLRKTFLAVDMRGRMNEPESRRKRERRAGNKRKEMDDGKWKVTQVMTLVNGGRWRVGASMEGGEGGKERQAEVKETPVFYSGLKKYVRMSITDRRQMWRGSECGRVKETEEMPHAQFKSRLLYSVLREERVEIRDGEK